MINRTAVKQLKLVVWGTSAAGLLAMIAIVVLAYQSHAWLRRERQSLDDARRDDLRLLTSADQVRLEREAAARQLESLSTSLAELKKRIPATPKEAEFLAQVSALAETSGVRLKNFRPGRVGGAASIKSCDVQLSLVGSFASICKLLDGLAEVPRILNVPRITLLGPPTAGDFCNADVTISLCFAETSTRP